MDMPRSFSWLSTLTLRKQGGSSGHEPADMGTAFGLDASFADELRPGEDGLSGAAATGDRAATDAVHGMVDRPNRRSVI